MLQGLQHFSAPTKASEQNAVEVGWWSIGKACSRLSASCDGARGNVSDSMPKTWMEPSLELNVTPGTDHIVVLLSESTTAALPFTI